MKLKTGQKKWWTHKMRSVEEAQADAFEKLGEAIDALQDAGADTADLNAVEYVRKKIGEDIDR